MTLMNNLDIILLRAPRKMCNMGRIRSYTRHLSPLEPTAMAEVRG